MGSRADIHALVAGVSLYVPGAASSAYPTLHGCADDAREVASYLTRDLEVPPEQVRLLTCSGDGPQPDEPEEQRPTYSNLVGALRDLATKARPRDQVLVYFAGHGTRVPNLIPEVKGDDLDECLVPSDAGTGARLLHDIEIAALVAELAGCGLDVTLALDCCHSGGALKAPGQEIAVRGVSSIDTAPRPLDSAVASRDQLAASWRETAGRPPAAVVLLGACRPGEVALEVLLQGRRRGIFTWALLDALRLLGPGIGYRQLHERVLARVHTLFEIQTPILDGNAERVVLGGEPRRPLPTVTVLKVEKDSVLVAAGAPQGVGVGAWFAIFPLGTENPSNIEERVALAEVTEAGAASSRARVTQVLRPGVAVEAGAPAVLLGEGVRTRRTVARLAGDSSPLLDAVIRRLADSADARFIEPAASSELADFRLAPGSGGAVEILDAAGEPLLELASPSGPDAVIASLEHLARYRNVQGLSNTDPGSDLAGALAASLHRLPDDWRHGKPLDLQPFAVLPPSVRPRDWLCLTIENRSKRELNFAVLDLQADWSIAQMYPRGAFLPLGAGRCEQIPFQIVWPYRRPRGRELFKVFAVVGTVDFRWLQLPALGEPPLPRPRGIPSNLDALFAALVDAPSGFRVLVPERQPQHAWTVVDLSFEVNADAR